jgi:hypothetical protein
MPRTCGTMTSPQVRQMSAWGTVDTGFLTTVRALDIWRQKRLAGRIQAAWRTSGAIPLESGRVADIWRVRGDRWDQGETKRTKGPTAPAP